jgi:hypothetical protein
VRARATGVLALLLAACGPAQPEAGNTAGDRIEAAARASGLVIDPASRSLTGSWARETDHACIVPAGNDTRIGVMIDYGEGQTCAGRGTLTRDGAALDIWLGGCRVRASYDGERITFPGAVPAACERLCSGRASLAALVVDRLSDSASEAATLRAPNGQLLCSG